ncbi:MAG: pyridoxal phosphate-dependent aminotransferase [Desulfobacterales bacterium]|nr:pyridoxal phosphate-dependent aminotransferase [Desulfobacterales bacterium]MDD4070879.1 pyridoxal phosphate-dependent aminotransferase [Desulfobacterales bacterium]MDD4392886.1 pyridoxal phosphate-dependent aminotransferase [Desulfobacterales bacterium]
MSISKNIKVMLSTSSWIRRMFEEGARLKKKYGAENVFDFSLGNPNLVPPEQFTSALKAIVCSAEKTTSHGYMSNAGYPHVRKSVSDYISAEQQIQLSETEILMTCGAAGALNVILKTLLDPGDEVVAPSPYFVEYDAYVANHGGLLKTVPVNDDFTLNIDRISNAIAVGTKAVLINSPNNPTGQIYSEACLKQLGELLEKKGKEFGHVIYLISDEPYRKIVYEGASVPSIFSCYSNSIIASSYSKDLSIPGERIGFIAVHPEAEYKQDLIDGMAISNRILGFVNAPALIQQVVASIQGASVNVAVYQRKRDLLCDGLADCGYQFIRPPGAFYVFPKTPIPDDVEFVRALQEELILVVPGSGFGGPGHFRIAYCVDDNTIINSIPGFRKVLQRYSR